MNKKSLILRILSILLIVAAIAYIIFLVFTKKAVDPDPIALSNFTKDTDGDKLPDWEEYLWGTNSDAKDTDGDGTNDADEIALNRDPRVAGPDDALSEEAKPIYARSSKATLTTTEAFEYDYFNGVKNLVNKRIISSESMRELMSNLSKQYLDKELTGLEIDYTRATTTVSKDSSSLALKSYTNKLGSVAINEDSGAMKSELVTLQDVVFKKDTASNAELTKLIKLYQKTRTGMEELTPVPESVLPMHLKMLRGVATIEKSLKGMQEYLISDPLKAMLNLSLYQRGVLLLVDGSAELQAYLKEKNITFSPEEPGSLLIRN